MKTEIQLQTRINLNNIFTFIELLRRRSRLPSRADCLPCDIKVRSKQATSQKMLIQFSVKTRSLKLSVTKTVEQVTGSCYVLANYLH